MPSYYGSTANGVSWEAHMKEYRLGHLENMCYWSSRKVRHDPIPLRYHARVTLAPIW